MSKWCNKTYNEFMFTRFGMSIFMNAILIIQGIFEIVEQVIRYNLVWVSLRLINREVIYEKRKLTQTKLYKYNLYNLFNNLKYSI
jgi:hypothetical protein